MGYTMLPLVQLLLFSSNTVCLFQAGSGHQILCHLVVRLTEKNREKRRQNPAKSPGSRSFLLSTHLTSSLQGLTHTLAFHLLLHLSLSWAIALVQTNSGDVTILFPCFASLLLPANFSASSRDPSLPCFLSLSRHTGAGNLPVFFFSVCSGSNLGNAASPSSSPMSQSVYSLKSPKGPLFPLRSILVFLIALFGFYVCYFSFNQINLENKENLINGEEQIRTFCGRHAIPNELMQYVHFPKPTSYSRGECTCTPVRFFVIISMQRSGSGWFETLLNSHPNVSSNGEIFSIRERREDISSILRTLDKLYNLDWHTSAAKNECTSAFGLKWMLNQGIMDHYHDIVNYLNKKGVMVIFLFRRNTLRRIISVLANDYDRKTKQLNGTHKAHVHSKEEADILARFKPKLEVPTLIPSIRAAEQSITTCLDHFSSTRHMILYYEDVIRDQNALSRVQEFLGVPAMRLSSRHVKIHTSPLPDLVDNWEEVSEKLNGTEYARFVDGADYGK